MNSPIIVRMKIRLLVNINKLEITNVSSGAVSETSQVIAPGDDVEQNMETNRSDTDVEFVGIQRKVIKRIFLRGIKEG